MNDNQKLYLSVIGCIVVLSIVLFWGIGLPPADSPQNDVKECAICEKVHIKDDLYGVGECVIVNCSLIEGDEGWT